MLSLFFFSELKDKGRINLLMSKQCVMLSQSILYMLEDRITLSLQSWCYLATSLRS